VELRLDPATGELLVRGSEVFARYSDPALTEAAFVDDRWFRTGDLGVIDDDGWLTITGRLKDVIIRGGENVTTSEVEAVCEAHPSVRQAVAVGFPDERLGERVAVFVVLAPGADVFDVEECRRWFERRGIARFKTPERVEFVESMPLLAAGKPDRRALQERLSS
jgi:acyl-CoA synthetase (AMP-forming)/AMP-acid ligase II